jgi:DNA uptake protein ComE-like DNA-binding protein
MKRLSFEPVKNWFGFCRRERRSSFILLILILSAAGIRFIIPGRDIIIEELPLEVRDSISSYVSLAAEWSSGSSSGRSKVSRQKPLLDINTCDSASLEALPGIGPVLSVRIIKYRNLLGGFAEVQQLKEVYGLPEETYNLVSGRIYADTAVIRKININTADYKQLIRMPYFKKYEVTAILKYRELKGRIGGMDDLIVNNLIAEEKAHKIKPYLEFGE